MTQENKSLLLQDLCARLPYGVKCYYNSLEIYDDLQEGVSIIKGFQNNGILVEIESGDIIDIEDIKPYLRPMSSMTKEEQKKFVKFHCVNICPMILTDMLTLGNECKMFDWLNEHNFDYRGLIEKGLALEASKGMYKTK